MIHYIVGFSRGKEPIKNDTYFKVMDYITVE